MPFILHDGPAWVIREALATHPAVRALQILDGLQPVQVSAGAAAAAEALAEQPPAAPAEPGPAAAEPPVVPPPAAGRKRHA